MKELKAGTKVRWKTPQGATSGRVVKKLISPTKIKGHQAKASHDNPEYLVRSEKSGKTAARKAEALKQT